jgi:acyl-CoA synthetase (AMP-forming)/AMP-acid ligase II
VIPIDEASTIIDSARRRELWHEPRALNLIEAVSVPARRYPDLPALFLSTDGRFAEPVTWSGLWSGALGQAARLSAAGVRAGEPVLLAVPTSRTFLTAFFGILAAGGVPVPIATPPSLNAARLTWYRDLVSGIAADAGARVLVTNTRFCEVLQTVADSSPARLRVLDVEPAPDAGVLCHIPSADECALLQYTSGSTSRPKGVPLTHANIIANAACIAAAIAFESSTCVSWLPLHHDMGLIGAALTALYSRVPVLLMPTTLFVKEPTAWLRAIGLFRATITLAPNFAFAHAVRHAPLEQLSGITLATLRTALNGAEPVDVAGIEAFEQKFGAIGLRPGVVRAVYGLAESALAVTFADEGERIVDVVDADALENEARARPALSETTRTRSFISVGRPLATQRVRIVGDAGRVLPERAVGEIAVSGPSVMHGYHRRPDETALILEDGWVRTGDLGYLAEGRLYLTGRLKDLIIRHGRNYHPPDIERVIAGTEGVIRGGSVAFGLHDDVDPQVIVVAETRVRQDEELDALTRRIRERCHAAFLFGPDEVCLVPVGGIPRTTSGKVRRHECRQLYLSATLPIIARRIDAPLTGV